LCRVERYARRTTDVISGIESGIEGLGVLWREAEVDGCPCHHVDKVTNFVVSKVHELVNVCRLEGGCSSVARERSCGVRATEDVPKGDEPVAKETTRRDVSRNKRIGAYTVLLIRRVCDLDGRGLAAQEPI
jgi:hypothetical protein